MSEHELHRLGERALLLRVHGQAHAQAIADALTDDLGAGPLEDVVPADRSLLLLYDGTENGERAARRALAAAIERVRAGDGLAITSAPRHRVIPVAYGGRHGPDLEETAKLAGVSAAELIELHTGGDHAVLFLGFAPGFAYLGDVRQGFTVPRLTTPRTTTRAGSVALAEAYTGIYPATLPGGWRVIGWTPVVLFDPAADPPTYLAPGDTVRFERVAAEDLPTAPYRPMDWAG